MRIWFGGGWQRTSGSVQRHFFPAIWWGVGQGGVETVSAPGGCQQGMVGAGALLLGSLSGHGQVPVLSSSACCTPHPVPHLPPDVGGLGGGVCTPGLPGHPRSRLWLKQAIFLFLMDGGRRGWQGSRVKSGSDQIPNAGQVPATTKKLPLPARAPAGRQRWAVVPSAPVIQSLQIEASSLPPMQGSPKPNCPGRQAQ